MSVVGISETKSIFNKIHPVFSRKRKDYSRNNFAKVEFEDEPYHYYLMGFSDRLNSNIDFFDSTSQLIGFGIDYSF